MVADGQEGVVADVVGDDAALGDGRGLIELPVDAKINSALTVFLFRLGESGEAARHQWPHIAGVVFGHAVEFVGNKGERNIVGPEKSAHCLENRAAETAVPGWISGKRRSEIRAGEIAGGCTHGCESWIAGCVRISIA